MKKIVHVSIVGLFLFSMTVWAQELPSSSSSISSRPVGRDVEIEGGISLHLSESGKGEPVIFVHGASGDYLSWRQQQDLFAAEKFRAIAYSRRYNHPNQNEPLPNHSAVVEALDLVHLLDQLGLARAHVIGHSYGAYTALFLALEHPERVKTLTLAEPPIVPWLSSIEGDRGEAAKEHREKLYSTFIEPAKEAFESGNEERATKAFLEYFSGKGALERVPRFLLSRIQRNLAEIKAIVTSDDPFPAVSREDVENLKVPTLVLSGSRSTATSRYTDDELERLLPKDSSRRVVLEGATHSMWWEQPEKCCETVTAFIRDMSNRDR